MPSTKSLHRYATAFFKTVAAAQQAPQFIDCPTSSKAGLVRKHFYSFRSAVRREQKQFPDAPRLKELKLQVDRLSFTIHGRTLKVWIPDPIKEIQSGNTTDSSIS